MGKYFYHKHKPDDLFGIFLVKQGLRIKNVFKKLNINECLFENLSETYKYPKNIEFKRFKHEEMMVESIHFKDQNPKYCIIQLHGGAYIHGFNDNYRRLALRYLKSSDDLIVYSPYYALAPKHPFPAGLIQVTNFYKNLLKTYPAENIIVVGDSAGGGLAMALGYEVHDQKLPKPKAMVLLSPWTDLTFSGESHKENKLRDIFFGVGKIELDVYAYAKNTELTNEKVSPKFGDFHKLPELLIFVGGNELIRSDSVDIALEYPNATVHEFAKMFHVFPLGLNFMSASRKAWEFIDDFINKQLKGDENHAN